MLKYVAGIETLMASSAFPVIDVSSQQPLRSEPMGSKDKLGWLDIGSREWLFKYARPGTGEDWAEKLACELAALIGLPHAGIELASHGDRRGLLSLAVTSVGDRLVHGNELLMELMPDSAAHADQCKRPYRQARHTLDAIQQALSGSRVPEGFRPTSSILMGFDVFVGYLMFDAWIGNTDRHHENWAVNERVDAQRNLVHLLAPTFDHATSLGA